MSELVERLWESDTASALTNEAAREITRLIAALEAEREKVAARERLLDEHAGARTALANGLLAENARAIVAEAKVAKLREAVRPFVEHYADIIRTWPKAHDDDETSFNLSDLRAAASAYKETGYEA